MLVILVEVVLVKRLLLRPRVTARVFSRKRVVLLEPELLPHFPLVGHQPHQSPPLPPVSLLHQSSSGLSRLELL